MTTAITAMVEDAMILTTVIMVAALTTHPHLFHPHLGMDVDVAGRKERLGLKSHS